MIKVGGRRSYIEWLDPETIRASDHSNNQPAKFTIEKVNMVEAPNPHVYIKDGNISFIEHAATYHYEPNVVLSTLCVKPQVNTYISINQLKTFHNICEIGVKYGSSSKWILDNNSSCSLDLYERDESCIAVIQQRLRNYKHYHLYEGDAVDQLATNNQIYDLVFFDCSHKYEIDIEIFKALLPHITSETVLVFDDYDVDDVQKLVAAARKIVPMNEFVYTGHKMKERK